MDFFERLIKMNKVILFFLCLCLNFSVFGSSYVDQIERNGNGSERVNEISKNPPSIHKDASLDTLKYGLISKKTVFYLFLGGISMIMISKYFFNKSEKEINSVSEYFPSSALNIFSMHLLKSDYSRLLKNFLCILVFGCYQDCVIASTQPLIQYSSQNHLGAWYHPPTSSDLVAITKANHPIVLQRLDDYHQHPLTNLTSLKGRLSILISMQETLSSIEEQDPTYKIYKKLKGLISKKSWYLEELIKIYEKEDPYLDIKDIQNNPDALVLINKIKFDFKLPVFWGLFWLEAIDPCHRFLTKHYMDWEKEKTEIPFFIWLETREISFEAIQVDYLPEDILNTSELIIENGLLKKKDETLADLWDEDKEFIYALSLDKKLFVIESGNRIRHTSLTHGKPVLGAGSIKIKNGIITFIDAESGHYQPTPYSLVRTLSVLEELGANLGNIDVKYYDESGNVFFETKDTLFEKYGSLAIQ